LEYRSKDRQITEKKKKGKAVTLRGMEIPFVCKQPSNIQEEAEFGNTQRRIFVKGGGTVNDGLGR